MMQHFNRTSIFLWNGSNGLFEKVCVQSQILERSIPNTEKVSCYLFVIMFIFAILSGARFYTFEIRTLNIEWCTNAACFTFSRLNASFWIRFFVSSLFTAYESCVVNVSIEVSLHFCRSTKFGFLYTFWLYWMLVKGFNAKPLKHDICERKIFSHQMLPWIYIHKLGESTFHVCSNSNPMWRTMYNCTLIGM